MRPYPFASEGLALASIRNAVATGHCRSGRAEVKFGGPGGRTVYYAHVQDGPTGWCLRRPFA